MKSERISPFWVNGYQPFSAQKVEALKKNKDNYYRTDFLFHSILDGASIETIYCDKDLSIFQDHK